MNQSPMRTFLLRHKKASIVVLCVMIAGLCASIVLLSTPVAALLMRQAIISPPYSSFQEAIDIALPPSATNFHSAEKPGFDGDEYWASAQLPHEDFIKLATALHLSQNPETLKTYPGALSSYKDPDISGWWCKKTEPDHETWFATKSDGYIIMTYEGGRFFLRRSRY